MPPDGGIVRPENVQMKPFFPKGELNWRTPKSRGEPTWGFTKV
jgi:hypothetical protein